MEVRGTAVLTVPLFVKTRFGKDNYRKWIQSLFPDSRRIMTDRIIGVHWYSLYESLIHPTEKICELFYNNDIKGAWEAGEFSCEIAFKEVYHWLTRVKRPELLIDKTSELLITYYRPAALEVKECLHKRAIIHITEFPEAHPVVEARIAGWLKRALEFTGCKDVRVIITKSLANGDPVTEIINEWK